MGSSESASDDEHLYAGHSLKELHVQSLEHVRAAKLSIDKSSIEVEIKLSRETEQHVVWNILICENNGTYHRKVKARHRLEPEYGRHMFRDKRVYLNGLGENAHLGEINPDHGRLHVDTPSRKVALKMYLSKVSKV